MEAPKLEKGAIPLNQKRSEQSRKAYASRFWRKKRALCSTTPLSFAWTDVS